MQSSILISEDLVIDFHKHMVSSRYFGCVYYSQFFERFENHKKGWYNIYFVLNLRHQMLRKSKTFLCKILVMFLLELVIADSKICERVFEDFI